jgi:hypothetical protein
MENKCVKTQIPGRAVAQQNLLLNNKKGHYCRNKSCDGDDKGIIILPRSKIVADDIKTESNQRLSRNILLTGCT